MTVDDTPGYGNALPLKSMLQEYRLESVLGAGGFGITYLGWDTHLEKNVAIKEYLPGQLAMRALDGSVVPVHTDRKYDFKWGLDRFIQEARTLAKFSHPNIVGVSRFFEANGTSYMVMPYESGESLHQYLKRTPMPPEATLRNILLPILDGLEAVHQAGFLHRDIKPSNVFMRENGSPVLLDFGAARMARGNPSQSLTAIVSSGYTPLEQYITDGKQGPWSDIYALACVMYRAITNENPPDAVTRMKGEETVARKLAAARERYSDRFVKAVELGMTVDEKQRPQSLAAWREAFAEPAPAAAPSAALAATGVPRSTVGDSSLQAARRASGLPSNRRTNAFGRPLPQEEDTGGAGKWLLAAVIGLALIAGYLLTKRSSPAPATTTPAVSATASQDAVAAAANRDEPARESTPSAAAPTQEETRVATPAPVTAEPAPAVKAESSPAASAAESPVARTEPAPRPLPPRSEPRLPSGAPSGLPAGSPSGAIGEMPAAVKLEFIAADRDRDGYLTQAEIRGRFPFIERNFTTVDADHDGRLSAEEFLQLRLRQRSAVAR